MRSWFVLVFAASGAAALVYEVTWTRLLTLQLGHGVAAASTVLAAFMGGLALGAALGGRIGARLAPSKALQVYATLEIAIAVLALALPLELRALNPLLAAAYGDSGGTAFAALRMVSSLLLLSIPAAAMGATFPIASRWFVAHAGVAARDAGTLYAANTVGAALGALAAGFLLLPALGITGATWVAVVLNNVAAAGTLLIAHQITRSGAGTARLSEARSENTGEQRRANPSKRSHRGGRAKPAGAREKPSRPTPTPALAAAALGLSGFASLTLQVVWTRLFALILGPTTYAFSLIVSIFIAGLAVGAAIASRLIPRVRHPIAALSFCLSLSVGLAAVSAALVDRGLLVVAEIVAEPGITFTRVLTRQAVLAVGLIFPMTVAFGAAFPFAIAAATRGDDTMTTDLGLVYAVNTLGAVAGALLSGFVLIPAAGLQGTLRLITIVGALGAIGLLFAAPLRPRPRVAAATVALAAAALGLMSPNWDRLLLSSGAYKYAGVLHGPDVYTALTAGELLYYREGASGTVAVRKTGGTTSLAIDGKVDASNAGDMLTQRLLAHVPLLLHPDPKTVAILGLGSGVTLGSALTHPIERADVLEISPEVAEASLAFASENGNATRDPRTRVILGDGRTHLLLTENRYDVIISEPSNPWMAGIASLFTQEFFQAAKARLSPGGVLCQWAHTYDISTSDLQSIIATFVSVFPDGTLWLVGDGDVLLVGSNAPLEPRLAHVARAWQRPGVGDSLATVDAAHPDQLLSLFVASGSELAQWSAGAALQSDDRSALEFSGPRNIFGTSSDNAALLRRLADASERPAAVRTATANAGSGFYRDRGWMLLQADAFRPSYDDFVKAVEADPTDARALEGLIRAASPLRRGGEARAVLDRLATDPNRQATKLALSRLLAGEGLYDQAVAIPFGLVQSDPSNVPALEQLASVLADVSDVERMRPVVTRLRAVAPASEAALYYSAALLFMENRLDLALAEARRVLAVNPAHAKAHNLMGACLAAMGQHDQARRAFLASLKVNPRDPATYTNLATLEMQTGNAAQATRYFAEALTIDPESGAARQGLAELQQR